ncbi:MAG: hypothetical protein K8F91_04190 [Candidatus Obscuribacterales bacterium]|nr:hypothetical protein [Candidatus Obscuribacterales bacterium]
MKLPSRLSPWSPYLETLGGNLPYSLAPTIQCLDRVIGPSQTIVTSFSDEPDGYDGIERRGSYERLLISEWLLADEFPDEFLRRATVSEHAFLQIARKSPSGKKRVTALFDCGPNQLGSPRIAHIAILIVLASRADADGMKLEWGILQEADMDLIEGASKESIEYLLAHRQIKEVSEQDLETWSNRLGVTLSQTFLIGGTRLKGILARQTIARLEIEDILEPGESALIASYKGLRGRSIEFRLPLPPPADCVRLLTRPFFQSRGTRSRHDDPFDLILGKWCLTVGGGGHFLLQKTADTVIAVSVPSNASRKTRQRIYSTRDYKPLIAAGTRLANYAAAILSTKPDGEFSLTLFGGKSDGGYLEQDFKIAGLTDADYSKQKLIQLFNDPGSVSQAPQLWMLLEDKIISIPIGQDERNARIVAEDVLTISSVQARVDSTWQYGVAYAQLNGDNTDVIIRGQQTGGQRKLLIPGHVNQLVIGPGKTGDPLLAYQRMNNSNWILNEAGIEVSVDASLVRGCVIGATYCLPSNEVGLLVVSETHTAPYIVGNRTIDLQPVPQIVQDVAINSSGIIAYVTEGGMFTLNWPDGGWQCYLIEDYRLQLISTSKDPQGVDRERFSEC